MRKRLGNLSYYILASIITSAIGIGINPFLAANLSHEDYAILGYFTSFNLLFLPIISFSFIAYYSRNYFRIQEDKRQEVLDTLLVSQLLVGIVGMIIVLTGFFIYMRASDVEFDYFPYALICFIPIFFQTFYSFLITEKKMKGLALSFFKIVVSNSITIAALSILFVVILKQGVIGRLWAIFIPSLGYGIYSFFKVKSRIRFNPAIAREAIAFGWPVSLSAILYYFLSGIDRAMLEGIGDITAFGNYNVAMQIATYLYVFYIAISQTFEPDLYKAIAHDDKRRLIKIVGGIITMMAIPIGIFVIFAKPVVRILTFGRYVDATYFAQILALKNLPMAIAFLVSNIIIGYGYPKVELANRIIGSILSVIMFKVLIDKYQFVGAAWGHTISLTMMALISSTFLIYKFFSSKRTRHSNE